MAEQGRVVGVFPASADLAGVVSSAQEPSAGRGIWVLFPDNADSRSFAAAHGTQLPEAVVSGPKANLPLHGKLGLFQPGEGPVEGALKEALESIGVPRDWLDRQIIDDQIIVAVACASPDEALLISGAMKNAGAVQVESDLIPETRTETTRS